MTEFSTSPRLYTPAELISYLPYTLSACSDQLGWTHIRVETGREPTSEGEITCPAGTHHELILPLVGRNTTFRTFGRLRCESSGEALLNEFDFIPSGYENYWRWFGGGCEYASFDIESQFLLAVAGEDLGPGGRDPELLPVAGAVDARLRTVANALVAEMESGGPAGRLFAESMMTSLAILILRRCSVTNRNSSGG